MVKIIFEKSMNQLFNYTYISEKQEAFEVIMDDARSYLLSLYSLQSHIIPCTQLELFHLHLYPELRDHVVNDAMKACRIKAKQKSIIREVKGRVAKRISSMVFQPAVTKIMKDVREILHMRQKKKAAYEISIKRRVLHQISEQLIKKRVKQIIRERMI